MRHLLLLIPLLLCIGDVQSAEYKTDNFTVTCSDALLAQKIGDAAEYFRAKHAEEWLGYKMPKWYRPCPIQVQQGNVGAGGATSFSFDRGHVFGWTMNIQGTAQRLLDSVVPHEVLHTVFASHFRQRVPRWADEGACSYVEHIAEKKNLKALADSVAGTPRQIPVRQLLVMQEYPQNVMTFYAQGFYISEHLIDLKGKREFVKFLETHFQENDWDTAFAKHYGYQNQEEAYTAAWKANRPATPVELDKWHIDVFVQSNCPPCNDFKTKDLPKLIKEKNVMVRVYDMDKDYTWERARQDGINGTPSFIIYKNEKRQAVLHGYHSAEELIVKAKGKPETVQVAQGVGIGYFGPVGGNRNKSNPHTDFNPQQLQVLQREIDSRAQVKIDATIKDRIADLEKLIDARIKNAILEIQSRLTDEQRALIGATDSQKAELAGLKDQIAAVNAAKLEMQKQTEAKVAELSKKSEELDKQIEQQKVEAEQQKSSIVEAAKAKAIEVAKAHVPEKVTGIASAAAGAIEAFGKNGPLGLGIAAMGWFLSRRKEEKAPATE